MARGEAWLKTELVKALNWDEFVAEGVVDVISKATSEEEIQEIVNDLMENNPVAISIISDYMAAKNASKQQRHQQSDSARAQPVVPPSALQSYSTSVTAASKPPADQELSAVKHGSEKWLNLGGAQLPSAQESLDDGSKDGKLSSKEQAEATLSMFKSGKSKVKPRGAASGAGSNSSSSRKGQQGLDSITANLERKVANCLDCGKIYDCRNVTNDIIRFIHGGFRCTFCGSTVAMTQQQRIQQAQQQADAAAGNSPAADDATARAIAFKDRLVDYDRNSQQRTTVIDNQSDYFEIDTNAWLSQEERVELRRREQLQAEAAAARKNKVFVTLDLLGRKVLVAEAPNDAAAAAAGGGGSGGAAFQVVSATDQLRQNLPSSSSGGAGRQLVQSSPAIASSAADDNSAKVAVGGQSAQILLDQALEAIRDLRITACPNIGTPSPVFVPGKHQQQQQQLVKTTGKSDAAVSGRQQKHPSPQQQKQQQQQQGRQQTSSSRRGGVAAVRAAAADSRIQDDSIFVDFEAELLYDDFVKQQQQQQQGIAAPSVQT